MDSLGRLESLIRRFCDLDGETASAEALTSINLFRDICAKHGIEARTLKLERGTAGDATRNIVADETEELRAMVADLEAQVRNLTIAKTELEERLRQFEVAPPPKKPRKERNEPVPVFEWTPEQLKIASALFLSGRKNEEICEAVGCNPNQVLARFNNGPPPFPVEVKTEGPITWEEAWQIGHDLFHKGWISKVINKLGIKKGACKPPLDINLQTTQPEIDALRELWRAEVNNRKRRRKSEPVRAAK